MLPYRQWSTTDGPRSFGRLGSMHARVLLMVVVVVMVTEVWCCFVRRLGGVGHQTYGLVAPRDSEFNGK